MTTVTIKHDSTNPYSDTAHALFNRSYGTAAYNEYCMDHDTAAMNAYCYIPRTAARFHMLDDGEGNLVLTVYSGDIKVIKAAMVEEFAHFDDAIIWA